MFASLPPSPSGLISYEWYEITNIFCIVRGFSELNILVLAWKYTMLSQHLEAPVFYGSLYGISISLTLTFASFVTLPCYFLFHRPTCSSWVPWLTQGHLPISKMFNVITTAKSFCQGHLSGIRVWISFGGRGHDTTFLGLPSNLPSRKGPSWLSVML